MLSHKLLTAKQIGKVASYYGDGADDYYAKEGDAQTWQGKGAEALGLSGEVDRERFRELLHGQVEPGGPSVRLSTRDDSKDRIGLDLTFSAPKSVSIAALVGGDSELIAMHDRAVAHALDEAELLAGARQKVGGKTRQERTGNLVIAKFRHETTRAEDPDLHTHSVVMNLTQRADGKWRALRNDDIIKSTKLLGALYRSELARELEAAGYEIRHGRDGLFELASVSREQIEAFSQRAKAIEEHLADQGLTRETSSSSQRQAATMATRDAKDPQVDRAAMHAEWRARAEALGMDFTGPEVGRSAGPRAEHERRERGGGDGGAGGPPAVRPAEFARAEAARLAIKYAVAHLSERDAVMDHRQIIDTAVKHSIGDTGIRDIERALAERVATGRLVAEVPMYRAAADPDSKALSAEEWTAKAAAAQGVDPAAARERVQAAIANGGLLAIDRRYTTHRAIERERQVLAIEANGRGAVAPMLSADAAAAYFAKEQLNTGQQAAATLILSTTNRVIGIEGDAGTGKSHMLDKAKRRIETLAPAQRFAMANGYTFRALAPYGSQVKALRELGVTANTLASFLKAKDKGLDDKTVIVLDEAGVVPARQMADLLKEVESAGARIILVGDTAQTKAIEAGRPFDQLLTAGMAKAQMREIQRQKNPLLKAAVELAARGNTTKALEKIGVIVEIQTATDRRHAIAAAFAKLTPADRDQTLIVAGTNESRREINGHVRDLLGLTGKGREKELLIRRDTTQAERRFSRNYRIGDVVEPEVSSKALGLSRGVLYKITATGPGNNLTVQSPEGETLTFNPGRTKLSVYQVEATELAPGDRVRITHNNAKMDVANGDRFTVSAIDGKSVTITDGKRTLQLPTATPIHLDLAYVSTVHGSQGLTEDRVFYDADTKSRTMTKDVFYVAMSRARHEFLPYTDDIKALPAAVARVAEKRAALDVRPELARPGPERGPRGREVSQNGPEAARA